MDDESYTVLTVDDLLRILIMYHWGTVSSVRNELMELQREVSGLKVFLVDAARKLQAEQLREMDLERQMKEVSYDTGDTLDYWFVRMAAAKLKNKLLRKYIIYPRLTYALGSSIKSIISGRLDPISRRIQSYEGDLGNQPTLDKNLQVPTEQLKIEDSKVAPMQYIVGFEDEVRTLISSVLEETEELDVIAITGMPGIGKTMLASRIYHAERIRSRIPTLIWVHDIPPQLMTKYYLGLIILKELIKQGTVRYQELEVLLDVPEQPCGDNSCLEILEKYCHKDRVSEDTLITAVRGYLKKSRYFLVADGVWDAESLSSIREILPNKGKVMITSRNNHIIEKQPHVLRFLNEKESWELLQLQVFGKLDAFPETLRSTGKRIAKECEGSPLAIVAVASSLVVGSSTEAANDLAEEWWKMVSKNVCTYIADYGAQHNVNERVELSYCKLPEHLQNCFLYLGMFPENHEVPFATLTHLWIAEGLVRVQSSLPLEKIAEKYLDELCIRNLVVVRKTYPNGPIKTCRLHTLLYGFCKHKAAEQDFYQEIRTCPVSISRYCRRLCIYSNLSALLSSTHKGYRVRSILCHNKEEKVVLHRKDRSNVRRHFKFLRVLECRYINFTKFHKWFTKLRLLSYISISCDELDVIPATISLLFNLETLVVETRSPSLVIEANIWRMSKLRNLVTKAAIVLAIKGKGEEAGNELQTMTRLAPACCTEDVFTRAPNLKTLGIRGQLTALSDPNSIKELQFLENMKLINEPVADTQLHLNCFPSKLKKLTLSGTYMGWESMSILGEIKELEILKLKDNAFVRGSWKTEAGFFGCLEFLLIDSVDLVSWEASDDCFPRLLHLVLKDCRELQEIPSVLANRLDTLDMENVSESAVASANDIEQGIARRQEQNKWW